MRNQITIAYYEYDSVSELGDKSARLLREAMAAIDGAYAPYSGFRVGAALLLDDGTTVKGSNQENVAYPSGLCAERTAIFAASAQRPEMRSYKALAIVGRNVDGEYCEASPCGACRQVLVEYERNQGHPMQVLCYLANGRIRVFEKAADLLPFSFDF